MNILFLTMSNFCDIKQKEIYPDLMREFIKNNHNVYIVSPSERRLNEETNLKVYDNCKLLRVKVGNLQKTNLIEKGISTLLIERQFKAAIKKYFSDVKFDLVLYSTPPITFVNVINYIRTRDKASTYLMLKDIFPQNAVDLGMFSRKSIIYKYFRNKEKKLYSISDYIGCMSNANVAYVLKHNPDVKSEKTEICPNSIEIEEISVSDKRETIRQKYNIPVDKKVFVYGGNLGKPQGIDFVIKCLECVEDNDEAFFLIVGSGTEYSKLDGYIKNTKQRNVCLLSALPKYDYELLINSCDVGMIFLDSRFTIPNYPSRILSYLQAGIPVLAATDDVTDIRNLIEEHNLGAWISSKNPLDFKEAVGKLLCIDSEKVRRSAIDVLHKYFDVSISYRQIMNHFEGDKNE